MLYIKAIHIIFVVTWFAGLFYIVRLFIYDVEAEERENSERNILQTQFRLMQRRLWYGITWPSAVLTTFSGIYLAIVTGYYDSFWFWLKIAFVIGLLIYHILCQRILNLIHANKNKVWTSLRLRMWNELATLFLVSIVFIVVLKTSMGLLYGFAGLIIITLLLLAAIRFYKKLRQP